MMVEVRDHELMTTGHPDRDAMLLVATFLASTGRSRPAPCQRVYLSRPAPTMRLAGDLLPDHHGLRCSLLDRLPGDHLRLAPAGVFPADLGQVPAQRGARQQQA